MKPLNRNPSASTAQSSMGVRNLSDRSQECTTDWSHFIPYSPSTLNTAFDSMGFSRSALLRVGSEMANHVIDQYTTCFAPLLHIFMPTLRPYFTVNSSYVRSKILRVLFPFLHRDWHRMKNNDLSATGHISCAPPLLDENAFDLYIPSMALFTYVILCTTSKGMAGEFRPGGLSAPDFMSALTAKCTATQLVEVLTLCSMLRVNDLPCPFWLDLISITGYKYVGLSAAMLVGMTLNVAEFGWHGYTGTFLWTASASSCFMFKTMAHEIPRLVSRPGGPKRELVLVGIVVLQVVIMWFISLTMHLS